MVRYAAGRSIGFLVGSISSVLLSAGSIFSIASLLSALCIAIAFLVLSRRPGKRDIKYNVMLRALFPPWLRRASFRADVWFLIFNLCGAALLLGWAIVSSQFISDTVAGALADLFGARPKPALNAFVSRSIVTVCLFLAYELAYWIDHYLSHRIPLLWEFHKVHHTAEVLSPITNFRVHPVDSVVFYNILGLFLGTTAGALTYLQLGKPFAIGGANAILVAFIFLTVHLQHSHVWIAATGALGRVILSPAHHQIHHSDNPIHFDKNFGSCLSLWDWLFGTLHMPERKRESLTFGIAIRARAHHTVMGCLVVPFMQAWDRVRPTRAAVRRESVL
jgi:sterol desaturase/sphingolipid hydroxylase (fatty acid hydroxylase superfamily)